MPFGTPALFRRNCHTNNARGQLLPTDSARNTLTLDPLNWRICASLRYDGPCGYDGAWLNLRNGRTSCMATNVTLPELGENIESGSVAKVLVSVGDTVEKDQALIEVETEKAVVEVPSTVAGSVKEIAAKEGKELKVGDVIAVIEEGAAGEESGEADDRRSGRRRSRRGRPEASKKKKSREAEPEDRGGRGIAGRRSLERRRGDRGGIGRSARGGIGRSAQKEKSRKTLRETESGAQSRPCSQESVREGCRKGARRRTKKKRPSRGPVAASPCRPALGPRNWCRHFPG